MRKWMRERGKRRKKTSENLSEATGKVGQALDPTQPAPIVPSYRFDSDDVEPSAEEQPGASIRAEAQAPAVRQKRIEVETQPESPSAPPASADAATRKPGQPQGVSKREPRGVVVLTIGLPGSGKTTWYKRRGVTPLSSDLLRSILFDSITEQRYQGLVFSTLRSLLRARLIAKMPWNYVDATNLSPHERRQWIKMARGFGYEVHAVFFDVPLELCLERNRKRERQVSEDVMKQMAQRLKPPTFKEGFSKIVVVRVKQDGTAQ
jgi:predicted kinase